jgi:hypothetical protein
MKAFLAFLLFSLWSVANAVDILTGNSATYNPNDPITITLTTTNQYRNIVVTINGITFANITDTVNGFTGAITFSGHITCELGALNASLAIVATTTLINNNAGPTSTVAPPSAFNNILAICGVYFTVPATEPAEILAAANFTVSITSDIVFADAYITLNGQFFCNLGEVEGAASCTGFVPCFLPACAKFAIVGRPAAGGPPVTYAGPTVQLTGKWSCSCTAW